MSLKYLNLSGLEDLWINIKNYILSKIPTKTSELTNDSGYLTSHQSLANYVDLNTTQTITAIKIITGGNQGKMLFKNPNYTKGDAVESGTTVSRLYFGNGASYGASNGILTFDITSSGNTSLELAALNNTASNSNRASLIITYDKSATRPRLLKSWGDFIPNSNDGYSLGNASNIWKECYSNVYYLGSTAFGDIVTHNASEFLTSHQSLSSCLKNSVTNNQTIKSTAITRGTAPSSTQTFGIAFSDNNSKYIGNIYGQYATDKSTYVGLYAYKGTTTANGDNVSVRVGYDASGNAYTYAPTPATADNSTQIATTAFVKAQGYLTSHQSLANYVTTNTDQSISGIKSHSKHISILGDYVGNESSTNGRSCLYLKANRDTDGQSGCYVTRYRRNKAQGALAFSDQPQIGIDFLENSVRTTNIFNIVATDWTNDVPGRILINSVIANNSFGSVTRKCLINELNPGSLSLPDLNNGIDISGYITVGTSSNTYTALADGYISILTTASSNSAIYWSDSNGVIGGNAYAAVDLGGTNRVTNITFPVNKGVTYIIVFKSVTNIVSAKFFPCLGNV